MSGSPSQFQIAQVEAALIELLKATMPAAYGTVDAPALIDIDSVGTRDFNAAGQLAIKPPSMRVMFAGVKYANLRDNQRLTYQGALSFEVMCFEQNLRSKADERLKTLVLVGVALNQLAGARLALADGTSSMPIELEGVQLVIPGDGGPVDQFFSIALTVEGIAQFNGPNARFGL
jgi:phage gp37-like protein